MSSSALHPTLGPLAQPSADRGPAKSRTVAGRPLPVSRARQRRCEYGAPKAGPRATGSRTGEAGRASLRVGPPLADPLPGRAESRVRSHGAGSVRLTRRGRVLVVLVLAVAVFALASVARVATHAGTAATSGPQTTQWVVQPGETLWSIAVAVAPGTDPRETVARIESLNDLSGAGVRVGQPLQVPTR